MRSFDGTARRRGSQRLDRALGRRTRTSRRRSSSARPQPSAPTLGGRDSRHDARRDGRALPFYKRSIAKKERCGAAGGSALQQRTRMGEDRRRPARSIGITDYAQNSLGDIVYVELPEVGTQISQFGNIGVVESVKAVSDLFTPISGEVVEVNGALERRSGGGQSRPVRRGLALQGQAERRRARRRACLSASDYEKVIAE